MDHWDALASSGIVAGAAIGIADVRSTSEQGEKTFNKHSNRKGSITMTSYKTTFCRGLVFVSALAMAGGAAVAEQQDRGPQGADRQGQRQGDRDGKRQHGDRGDRGDRANNGERRGPRDRGMQQRLFAGMDLSDEQKTQVRETMKKFGDERRAWHDANKDQFQAIKNKMRAAREAKDKDAMQAARDEIRALMESGPKPGDAHDQVRALLNEEQQALFDERTAKMKERMQQWKDSRGDGTPGPPPGRHGFAPPDGPGRDGPPMDGPPRGDRREHAQRLFGNLDLTDEQRDNIRDTMRGDGTREEKMAAVRESLTEDQQARLDENLEKMRKYREEHKGEHGERGERRPRDGNGEGRRHDRRQNGDGNDDKLDL
jgi:hypothetical protein